MPTTTDPATATERRRWIERLAPEMPGPWEIVIFTSLVLTALWQNTWDTTHMRDEQRLALSKLVEATAAVERAVDAADGGVAAVREAVVAMDRNGARWQKVVVTTTVVASLAGATLGALLTIWLRG